MLATVEHLTDKRCNAKSTAASNQLLPIRVAGSNCLVNIAQQPDVVSAGQPGMERDVECMVLRIESIDLDIADTGFVSAFQHVTDVDGEASSHLRESDHVPVEIDRRAMNEDRELCDPVPLVGTPVVVLSIDSHVIEHVENIC